MTNLERLKLQLNNQEYYTDEEYSVFLSENGLEPTSEYIKKTNQIGLMETVLAVMEVLANDTDMMRKINVEGVTTINEASKYISNRIKELKATIAELKEEEDSEFGNVRPLFFN